MKRLTRNQLNTINAIIAAKTRIALDMEAVKDDVKALANETGLDSSQVNRIVTLVMKEQGKGGVLQEETRVLELAEQIVGQVDEIDEDVEPEQTGSDLFPDPEIEDDPKYPDAVSVVLSTQKVSVSMIQRQLGIGYNRAARLVERMEENGVVSVQDIHGNRSVLQRAA